jgi:molybdopterin-guanine dinucleotide biosynthesis adapter protein
MPPVICIVGKSNSGKTTIIQKIIYNLKKRSYKIGVIKHAPSGFNIDTEGKDSFKHAKAGADTVIVSSLKKIAMVKSNSNDNIENLLPYCNDMDIIIVEGYKKAKFPKIEVFRKNAHNAYNDHKGPVCKKDKNLIAFISDDDIDTDITKFSRDNIEKISDFIENQLNLSN